MCSEYFALGIFTDSNVFFTKMTGLWFHHFVLYQKRDKYLFSLLFLTQHFVVKYYFVKYVHVMCIIENTVCLYISCLSYVLFELVTVMC